MAFQHFGQSIRISRLFLRSRSVPARWSLPFLFALISIVSGIPTNGVAQVQKEPPEAQAEESADAAPDLAQLPLRDLNSYFPFRPPTRLNRWKARRTQLREQIRLSLGLIPEPPRTPLNPVIHGRIDQGDYTIEKVYFESMPGFFVTGNLYRPTNAAGRLPAVLSPHGHHKDGRFRQATDAEIDDQIKQGAETFRPNAKSVLQARCANLARMGCVVFHFDMIGYADSQQISEAVAHRFAKQNAADNSAAGWSLFTPLAELNQQSVMGLQAWNSIRALDFLSSLDDVDPERIGVTGASGGGTQTFILCAIDDRPAVAFPAVMVSTAMQGGCTCENCSLLRIDAGNVDFAALFAPKPLGLSAADDWTKEMQTKGFPELKQLYKLYGKPENVLLLSRTEFKHNYNQVSREAMYGFFKKHLEFRGEPVEREIVFVDPAKLSVFDDDHPRPQGGSDFEKNLTRVWAEQAKRQLEVDFWSLGRTAFEQHKANQAPYHQLLNRLGHVQFANMSADQKTDKTLESKPYFPGRNQSHREIKYPDRTIVIDQIDVPEADLSAWLICDQAEDVGDPGHAYHGLAKSISGQFRLKVVGLRRPADFDPVKSRRVANPREALAYTMGYNAPDLVETSVGWLDAMSVQKGRPPEPGRPANRVVIGLGNAGLQAVVNAPAFAQMNDVTGMAIDTDGFRFAEITDIQDRRLIPGAVRFGDVPGFLSTFAPKPLLLIGETAESSILLVNAYFAHGAEDSLKLLPSGLSDEDKSDAIDKWLAERQSVFTKSDKPRVLILGDSISIGYTPFVQEEMSTEAYVFRPMIYQRSPENCAGTDRGISQIDRWLDANGGQWDVIHFNFGLHDLKHVDAETGKNSNDPSGPYQSSPEDYERQLREIVGKLKKTGAKLILCTTTPVPEGVRPLRETTAPGVYNEIAIRIAKENEIMINDLYSFAESRLSEIQQPANVHFSKEGSKALGDVVVNAIRSAIKQD